MIGEAKVLVRIRWKSRCCKIAGFICIINGIAMLR